MGQEEKQRLGWVKLYEQTHNAGLTCRRCGISRPTLRKCWRQYQTQGEAGLQSMSRRPHCLLAPENRFANDGEYNPQKNYT